MEANEIIEIISKHSLTVRCLPHIVVSHWTYREGDENRTFNPTNGAPLKKLSVVIQDFDLEHFQKTPPPEWMKATPEQRYEKWKKQYPNGKKLLREERTVEKGGWWYVKVTKNTDSTVRFSREYDKFFAPTLPEAIQLFLDTL